METIVVEHHFEDRPFNVERYETAQLDAEWCLKAYGVRHVKSYLSPDGHRMICIFEAPDAEAVRRVSIQLGYSYDRLWKATIVE